MKGLEKKVVGFILAILFMLIVLILITRLLQVSAGKIDFNEIWDLSAGWKDEQPPPTETTTVTTTTTIPSGECNSLCAAQPEFDSGTCRSSRLYVDGKYIKVAGQPVHLAGAAFGPMWNIELSKPGSIQAKEKNIQNMKEEGANLVFLVINLELWNNPDYSDHYKQNVDAWVEWIKKYDMFFIIKLHCSRYEYDVFSDAGTNWKIAEYEPQRSQAIQMYVEMANKWKNLPNFVGISLLNEPAGWDVDDKKWDVVTEFYLDAIDAIREVDPECIIFVQAPYRSSGYPKEWVNREFLQREGIVLEFHQYYCYRVKSEIEEWAVIYKNEGPEKGREAYEQWLVENIISVRDEYDIPILAGEFGVRLDSHSTEPLPDPDVPYWEEQHTDNMKLFNEYKVHYSQWRVYNRQGTGHTFAMCTSDGLNFNFVGQNWAANLPSDLIRPSYLEGKCEDGETPIEDGCSPGYVCCCSGELQPSASTSFKKFIVLYGSYQPSDEDLEYLASNFDFIDTEQGRGEDVANLKEMNPDIIVVFYKDLIGMYSYYSDWGEVDKHRDWFLHDTGGNRIINKNFGWYLMDPSSDGWRNYYAGQVKDELDRNPQYDGVFADDCWGDFYNYFTVGDEKLPDITKEEWNNDINGMLKVIKDQIGDKLIIVNSNTPFDYMQYADGRMDESFAHAPWHGPNTFHTVGGWKEKIDALYQWSGNDKYLMANGGVEEGATDEEKESLMKFCLSSYLLGVNGPKALFGFKPPTKSGGYSWGVMDEWLHPEYERVGELGDPIGKYYSEGSIYFRDFENGKVIVNPSSGTPLPINLDQNYKTLDGKIVSKVTLDDHSGIILLKIS